MSNFEKRSPAERVTQAIAAALRQGVRPWAKPWRDEACSAPLILPRRANGVPYRGMNVVALWAASEHAGYTSPYWFTFKQALALHSQVRKGERGAFVLFYKALNSDDPSEDIGNAAAMRQRCVLRGYVVFNRAQIDGLDGRYDLPAAAPTQTPDQFAARFARIPAQVRYGGARAFYAPSTDHVQMPPQTAFIDASQFYATLAHELGHWTRHPSRLDRDFGQKRFGDHG